MEPISQYAIKLLTIRDRTEQELARRLEARFGAAPPALMAELRNCGYLDDRRFAKNYLERRPGLAPERARAELLERGVEQRIAEEEVEIRVASERPSLTAVLKATMIDWRLTAPLAPRDAGRLFRRLARLGYRDDEIAEELEQLNG